MVKKKIFKSNKDLWCQHFRDSEYEENCRHFSVDNSKECLDFFGVIELISNTFDEFYNNHWGELTFGEKKVYEEIRSSLIKSCLAQFGELKFYFEEGDFLEESFIQDKGTGEKYYPSDLIYLASMMNDFYLRYIGKMNERDEKPSY